MTDSTNSRFQRGPNPGGSGNPGGIYNTAVVPQIQPGYYGQQSNQGRYRPPTLGGNGTDPTNWNDYGGYSYNVPNHYGVGSGWQSPQMSPFPQFTSRPNSAREWRALGQTARPLGPGGQREAGVNAFGGEEAYAAWRARRDAMRNSSSEAVPDVGQFVRSEAALNEAARREWIARGGDPNAFNFSVLNPGEAPPTRGSPYRGPQETHVGGPSTYPTKEPTYPTKGPPIDGGTKGPALEEEPLEDWMPRFRTRNSRWGRY